MNFIEQFHYRISGNPQAEKLVFLHGLMGFGNNWRSIAKAFEQSFHILTYDQRGHGRSFQPPEGYEPEDYAADLLGILEELGWSQIHLVGHSMGARNANHFAYRYPEKVLSLVLEDLGPEAQPESVQKNDELLQRVGAPFASKALARQHIEKEFADNMVLGEYLYANLEEKPSGEVSWRFFEQGIRESVKLGRSRDRWQEFESLRMPCLVIRGERSEEFPAEIYKSMLVRNPNVIGIEIAGAAHWVHFDQKEKFIEALWAFYQQHGIGAADTVTR